MNDVKDLILYDNEFRNLIPPLSEDEYKRLEDSCIKEGVREPLVVWRLDDGSAFLVDGYNRTKIAMEHGLRVETRDMHFETRADAIAWIINNQIGRRNVDKWVKFDLVKKLEETEKEKAKERQETGGKLPPTLADGKGDTRDKLAELVGVSHGTFDKMKAIDEKASDKTKQLVREGKLSINQAYNSVHKKRPDPVDVAKEEHKKFEQDKTKKVVSLKDAQTDKINQKIIDNALMQEFLKVLNVFDDFMLSHNADDLEKIASQIPDDEVNLYVDRFDNCTKFLLIVKDKIVWR